MRFIEYYDHLSDKEKTVFQTTANQLLSSCFLCRDKKESREAFYFVVNHKEIFDGYFNMIGWEVNYNNEIGCIQLLNSNNRNLLKLKKNESIILIILRILYQEQIENFTTSNYITVRVDEIHAKYDSLEFKKKIYKTDLVLILRLFKRFNIIDALGDVTKGNCPVIIYPTILMAVGSLEVDSLYSLLKNYENMEQGGEVSEEANQD